MKPNYHDFIFVLPQTYKNLEVLQVQLLALGEPSESAFSLHNIKRAL